jgi:hypothetical protein
MANYTLSADTEEIHNKSNSIISLIIVFCDIKAPVIIIIIIKTNYNYKHLNIYIQRIWDMKCFVMPVIVRVTGIVSGGLKNVWKQYQDNINRFSTKDRRTWNVTHHK